MHSAQADNPPEQVNNTPQPDHWNLSVSSYSPLCSVTVTTEQGQYCTLPW